MEFIIINGKVVSKQEANLTEFLWDEPFILSQKVWYGFGGIPLFHENIDSIEKQLNTFQLSLPALFKNKRELFRITKRMLNKNKFYRSGFIQYRFFISGTKINSLISSTASSEFDFPFNSTGKLVQFSSFKKNSQAITGRYKIHNHNLWEAAKAQTLEAELQDSILVNEKDNICEGVAANIFMIKDKVLITPALDSGCYEDVLRPVILDLAKSMGVKVVEISDISIEHIFSMNEVFFASGGNGIEWVLGIETKRFVHEYSDEIYDKLNTFLKAKII